MNTVYVYRAPFSIDRTILDTGNRLCNLIVSFRNMCMHYPLRCSSPFYSAIQALLFAFDAAVSIRVLYSIKRPTAVVRHTPEIAKIISSKHERLISFCLKDCPSSVIQLAILSWRADRVCRGDRDIDRVLPTKT